MVQLLTIPDVMRAKEIRVLKDHAIIKSMVTTANDASGSVGGCRGGRSKTINSSSVVSKEFVRCAVVRDVDGV